MLRSCFLFPVVLRRGSLLNSFVCSPDTGLVRDSLYFVFSQYDSTRPVALGAANTKDMSNIDGSNIFQNLLRETTALALRAQSKTVSGHPYARDHELYIVKGLMQFNAWR